MTPDVSSIHCYDNSLQFLHAFLLSLAYPSGIVVPLWIPSSPAGYPSFPLAVFYGSSTLLYIPSSESLPPCQAADVMLCFRCSDGFSPLRGLPIFLVVCIPHADFLHCIPALGLRGHALAPESDVIEPSLGSIPRLNSHASRAPTPYSQHSANDNHQFTNMFLIGLENQPRTCHRLSQHQKSYLRGRRFRRMGREIPHQGPSRLRSCLPCSLYAQHVDPP